MAKNPKKELYTQYVVNICKDLDLNPALLAAIIEVESAWKPYAIRYEPSFELVSRPAYFAKLNSITETTERAMQRFSWGLTQILGCTARDIGFKGPMQSLCVPECGILWGATYLKRLTKRYANVLDQVAAYNAGEAKKRVDGTYINQEYVEKVMKNVQV